MSIDVGKTALALAKAALSDGQQQSAPQKQPEPRKPRVSTGKAMLLGAGLVVAGQALAKARGPQALDSVQHLLTHNEDDQEPEAPDEEEFDDDEYDDEPEAVGDEDVDDDEDFDEEEYDDEPEAESDEDYEDDDEDLDEEDDVDEDDEDDEDLEDEEERPRSRRRKAASGRRRG
jgi:hypothetical protein